MPVPVAHVGQRPPYGITASPFISPPPGPTPYPAPAPVIPIPLVGRPPGGPGHPVSFGQPPGLSSAAPIVGGNGGNVGMNPPAVIDLAAALSASSPELEAIAKAIAQAEAASGLTSGTTGAIGGLADMTSGAGIHLTNAADDLAGFRLPNMPTGIGGVTGSLTTPGNAHPLAAPNTSGTTQNPAGQAAMGIAPALPVTSPNSTQSKGTSTTPIGAAPTPTIASTGTPAAKGGAPIGGPPALAATPLNPIGAIPPVKGATTTPITSTTQNPAGQAAMGLTPNQAQTQTPPLAKGGTATPIGSIPAPLVVDPNDPWAAYAFMAAGEFGGLNDAAISKNQDRIDALVAQGFHPNDALTFVLSNGSPNNATFGTTAHLTSLTVAELNYLASTWEESGKSGNDPIIDAIINELDNRAEMAGGQPFSLSNVQALIVAEVMSGDYEAIDVTLQVQAIDELNNAIATMHPTQRDNALVELQALTTALVGDKESAAQIAAAMQAGNTFAGASGLVEFMEATEIDARPIDVAIFQRQINALVDDDFTAGEAAAAILTAQQSDIDAAAIKDVQLADGGSAGDAALQIMADEYDMSVEELLARATIAQNEEAFDTAHQTLVENKTGELIDGFTSVDDFQAVVDNPDEFSAEVVAAAQYMVNRAEADPDFADEFHKKSLFESFKTNFIDGESQVGGLLNLFATGGLRVTPGAIEFGENLIADGGYLDTIAGAADQIMTINPMSPRFIELALTDPGQLLENYKQFGLGIKDFGVDLAKLGGALAVASNPVTNALYEEMTGTNVKEEINNALLGAAEMFIVDPDALAGALVGYDLLKENPLRWAGQQAPEIVLEILTGGAVGAGIKGSKALDAIADIADAAEDIEDVAGAGIIAGKADDLLPDYQGLAAIDPDVVPNLYHYTDQKFVDSILEGGLRPGTFATPDGDLSGIGAVIDLALPPNRPHPNALIEIDVKGMVDAGLDVPAPSRVTGAVPGPDGQIMHMPGGGLESQIPGSVPPEFLRPVDMTPSGGSPTGGLVDDVDDFAGLSVAAAKTADNAQARLDEFQAAVAAGTSPKIPNPAQAIAGSTSGDNITDVIGNLVGSKGGLKGSQPFDGLVLADGTIPNPDKYMDALKDVFEEVTGKPLHEDLSDAIQAYLENYPGSGAGINPVTGMPSHPGRFPGTHAEVAAVNEALHANPGSTLNDIVVITTDAKGANPMVACPHCAGILDEVTIVNDAARPGS